MLVKKKKNNIANSYFELIDSHKKTISELLNLEVDYPFATEVMDVADAAQVAQVCQRVLQKTPRLDVLVNAAGILR
ncbi:SDR family NAD(P)-dependent oxidoreductase, partial [Salmonella enterica subsp. enterica serovar Kentucky]|nr:SDR family NAD(P)-dependent oxidoreductase [Salmonella enterica subsp. enterica serovar Kentucky]